MKKIHEKAMLLWQRAQSLRNKMSAVCAQMVFAGIDGAIGSEMVLSKNESLALANVDALLHCDEGQLWITRDGDREDYIVNSGQSFTVRAKDQAVVLSMSRSRVRFEEAPRLGPSWRMR
jgi:hypothetical protein